MLPFILCTVLFSFSMVKAQPELFINEFLASNTNCYADEFGEYDDWVEIYNAGTEPINIGGMYITDKLDQPMYYQIPSSKPDSTTIQPGGFLLLWCDEDLTQGVLHVNIKLKGGGEQIGLYDTDGVTPIDMLTYDDQTTDISYGRTVDGGPDWTFFQSPTPGRTNNQVVVTPDLVINEFLAINDSIFFDNFGEDEDWVEIYNVGAVPVDIGGMYITDSLATPTMWQIPTTSPDSTIIAPGSFLVLWCDKDTEQGILHVDLKLSGNGEQLGLFDTDGLTPIDALTFYDQQDNVSYGRYTDGETNWVFFSSPTPGAPNISDEIPAGLFINEFLAINDSSFFDDYDEDDDWLEIYNAGTEAVNLGGLYLTDDLSNPKGWRIPVTEPDSTSIQPGGFLVFWCDNDADQGVLHTEIGLSGSGEQIGLFAADGISPVDTLNFEQQESNISYGRFPDGSENWYAFTMPTPGEANSVTAIDDKLFSGQLPDNYVLEQNYPNPFNPKTHISYRIPVKTKLTIKIYNLRGEEIKTVVNDYKNAGSYLVQWNGSDNNGSPVASGIYLCRIKAGEYSEVRKMLLVK